MVELMVEKYVSYPGEPTKQGVKFIVDNKRALIADGMGLYKTSQAVHAKYALEDTYGKKIKALVVCPTYLKEHWERRIREYCEREPGITKINAATKEGDLEDAKDSEFTIIGYDLLPGKLNGKKGKKEIVSELQEIGFNYVIGDEIHMTKAPKTLRSQGFKKLANKAEYLALLSGTPIPNMLDDAFVLVSMLYPEEYATEKAVREAYGNDPTVLRWMLNRRDSKMLRREVSEVRELPELTYHDIGVELNKEQEQVYAEIYMSGHLGPCTKLNELRKALLDPALVNPDVIQDEEIRECLKDTSSSKYEKLDELVEECINKDEKIVIFSSHFRTNVTDKLEKRYEKYGAIRIDGTVSPNKKAKETWSERERKRREFQENPDKKILIATLETMSLGTELTTAQNVIFLDQAYTHTEANQGVKRVHRPGQTKPVKVYNLIGKYKGNPYGSIDDGIKKYREDKEEIIDNVIGNMSVRKLTMDERSKVIQGKRGMNSKVAKILTSYLDRPQEAGIKRNKYMLYKQGAKECYKRLKGDEEFAEAYAKDYIINWEGLYQGKISRVYKEIIQGLMENGENLEKMIDLGSGPAILSKVLDCPTVNVDLNKYQLREGKKFSRAKNGNIQASIHELPLKNKTFDLALCSSSVYYTSLEENNGFTEREQSIREANRILRDGGYYIITIPPDKKVNNKIRNRFEKGLNDLNFKVVPELSGFVKAKEPKGSNFKAYVVVSKKIGDPTSKGLDKNQFALKDDSKKRKSRARQRRIGGRYRHATGEKREICKKFAYYEPGLKGMERGIEECLDEYLEK